MAEGDLITKVGWEVIGSGAQPVVKSARDARAAILDVASANDKLATSAVQATASLARAQQVSNTLADIQRRSKVDTLAQQYGQLALKIKDSEKAALQLVDALNEIGATEAETRRATEVFAQQARVGGSVGAGGIERGAMGAAGLVGGVLGQGAAEPLRLVADVAQASETLPLLAKGITDLIPASKGGIAALGATGVAIVALGVVLSNFTRQQEQNKAALGGALGAVDEYYDFIASGGTVSQAREKLTTLDNEQNALLQKQADLQKVLNLARNQEGGALGALSGPIRALADLPSEQLEASLADVTKELEKNAGLQKRFTQGLEEGSFAADKAAESEKELTQTRADTTDAVKKITDQEAGFVDRLNALGAQEVALRSANTTRVLDLAEDRHRRDEREEADYTERREAAAGQHRDRLAAINDQIAAVATDLADAITGATGKANAAIASVNSEFMQSEIKAVDKFRDDEKKRTAAYNKQRVRDLEDLHDTLADAEQANDVIAFLRAQREGRKNLRRQEEDFDDETRLRQDAFDAEREQTAAARQARIDEINAGLATELASLRTNADERRAELLKNVEAEKAAFEEQDKLDEAAREKRLERQAEDDRIANQRAQRSLSASLTLIDQKTAAESAGLLKLIGLANELVASVASASAPTTTPVAAAGYGGGGLGVNPFNVAFANEGMVDRPTRALIGDRLRAGEAEAVVKFRKSQGLLPELLSRASGRSGQSVVISPVFNVTVGDIASRGEVEQALVEYNQHLTTEIAAGLHLARGGPAAS